MQPNTVHTRIKLLYALLKFLVDRDVVPAALVTRKLRIKVPEALPRALEPEDVRQLLAVITHERDRALILVLLRTGMRIGELLDTRMSEVNLREKSITIREAQKNRVGRVVYLSEDACQALQVWLEKRGPEQGYLFYGQGRQRLSYTAARVRLGKHLARAGLTYKGYSLHCLRHTCATDLLNAGMRLECVQQILGHSSIEMTRRYARLTDNTRREEYFRALVMLMLRCGLRVEEVSRLKLAALDLRRRQLFVQHGKGGKDRVVCLSDDAQEALIQYLRVRPASRAKEVFLVNKGRCRGQAISVRGIQKRLEHYARQAKLKVSCHQLRHTMATQLLNADAPLVSIQDLLGHSRIKTTQRYCRVSNLKVQRDYHQAMTVVLERTG